MTLQQRQLSNIRFKSDEQPGSNSTFRYVIIVFVLNEASGLKLHVNQTESTYKQSRVCEFLSAGENVFLTPG